MTTIPNSTYEVVSMNQINAPILISRPVVSSDVLSQKVSEWLEKQGEHWPSSLSTQVLLENLTTTYLPYWQISGSGEGAWSALIGTDFKQIVKCNECRGTGKGWNVVDSSDRCGSCRGTGTKEETVTKWDNQTGYCKGQLELQETPNFDEEAVPRMRCGKPDLSAKTEKLSRPYPVDILVLHPALLLEEQGLEKAREQIRKNVEADGRKKASGVSDHYKEYDLDQFEARTASAWMRLYPIYLSTFKWEEDLCFVQLDGITGTLFIQTPGSIASARMKAWLRKAAPYLVVATLIIIATVAFLTLQRR